MIWGQTTAGVLLGLILSAGLCGLYALLALPSFDAALMTATLLLIPLWIAIMTLSFRIRSGLRAWASLGLANLACYGLLWALRAAAVVVLPV
ncbi:MAG: hypothetical protein JWQ90_2643 [Hydrocarboniphaga sp.]|uniref:hypothetical protein n=1 Tax=Hydrocarboniphaga sp. TaxID=2033016 RepID=UPI00261A6BDB|nr:hypothetical protein [Hydrocarboniphaga sp.]MDB5970193.1 hypothetical protein [Hydrocarboniphaga sp.]